VRAADFRYAIERTLELNDKGAGSFLQGIVGAPDCLGGSRPCRLPRGSSPMRPPGRSASTSATPTPTF